MAALDDRGLGAIRGGLDTSSGVQLNFAFQQATYLNHSLVQTVIVPTITVSQNMAGLAASPVVTMSGRAATSANASAAPSLSAPSNLTPAASTTPAAVRSVASPNGLGISGPSLATSTSGNTTSIVSSSGSQMQAVRGVQSLAGNGMSSILTTLGSGGLTNVVSNTANNQLVQQVTSVDIGVSGLSKLVQSGVSSSVMNRLTPGAALFR